MCAPLRPFPAGKRKGLDASLVWSEVQSTLKGSMQALRSPKARLTEDAYVDMANS